MDVSCEVYFLTATFVFFHTIFVKPSSILMCFAYAQKASNQTICYAYACEIKSGWFLSVAGFNKICCGPTSVPRCFVWGGSVIGLGYQRGLKLSS